MTMQFKKAERKQAKLRLGLTGPSGAGKSFSGLLIARGLAKSMGGGRIGVIDTEQGSASLYAHLTDFDTLTLDPPYTPERYIEAMRAAEQAKFDILLIDSITHEWNGAGGCLEINDMLARTKYKGNTWSAWSETTPRHRKFMDYILQSKLHIIATMRSKTDTVQEGGKVKKLGLKSEQRDGSEYEFTTVLSLTPDGNYATADKDRTELFRDPHIITEETGVRLFKWLNTGAAIADLDVQTAGVAKAIVLPDAPPAEQSKPQQSAPFTPPAPDATNEAVAAASSAKSITEMEAAWMAAKAHYSNKRIDNAGMGQVVDALQTVAMKLISTSGKAEELDVLLTRTLAIIANPQRQEAIKAAANARREQLVPVTQQAEEEVDLFA